MNTFGALKQYLAYLQINEGSSPRTVSSYHNDLNQYLLWLDEQGVSEMEEVTGSQIEEFAVEQSLTKKPASGRAVSA